MPVLSSLYGTSSVILSNLFIKLPAPQAHPDLPNQTIIVTGSNTGLGLETSRHLLRLGLGKLIMAVRNPAKGRAARDALLASTGRAPSSIDIWPLDMADPASVRAFAERAAAQLPRLDGVLANAGLMTEHFTLTGGGHGHGHETTLAVNVLGPFLLCLLLLPAMRASGRATGRPCRFVVPNSALHYLAPLGELEAAAAAAAAAAGGDGEGVLARLDDPARADMAGRYAVSKLLVVWGVRELAARLGSGSGSGAGLGAAAAAAAPGEEVGVIVNTPNPSYCVSGLVREKEGSLGLRAMEKLLARTTEEGSRTLYHGLFAGEESHGQYLTNCHVQTPACHVTNEWGQRMQKKFFDELLAALEEIQPGVSKNI
ncbi:uncharacterized protein B0H64DRAFT_477334 [Chaetomium fimeti]|uniref:Uncharacterized protein n=1 Tax=Chaetomium fimeti TaxID=1854472 RepID=A0AAE0LP65_9PEZI|nr:hypothetical protein B0H64DRAFT_477334 [Chaetomium fimeti]